MMSARLLHTIVLPFTFCLLGLAATSPSALGAETYDVDAETGYRMGRYRAPVPASIPGGITVDTPFVRKHAQARDRGPDQEPHQGIGGRLLFLDVFPPKGLGPDPLDGHWIISEPHHTIEGSTWLPEVGRGFLEAGHEDYFRRNLKRLTNDDQQHPLLFFCTADCWQSWNAARRALSWGYSNVYWYPTGTNGWQEEGGDLVLAKPLNYLDDTVDGDSDADANSASDTSDTQRFPEQAGIFLQDANGDEVAIGHVRFQSTDEGRAAIDVSVEGDAFSDQFLSMRPFKCLTHESEWFCYLPYNYPLKNVVSQDDLVDLEYHLMFILKSPEEFGIDAWNGIYYQLEWQADGTLLGRLLQGDLNVLASPPEADTRPVSLLEFIDDEASLRRFPTLVIRP